MELISIQMNPDLCRIQAALPSLCQAGVAPAKAPSASETHPEPGELFVLHAISICGKEAAFGSVRDFTAGVFAACLPGNACCL